MSDFEPLEITDSSTFESQVRAHVEDLDRKRVDLFRAQAVAAQAELDADPLSPPEAGIAAFAKKIAALENQEPEPEPAPEPEPEVEPELEGPELPEPEVEPDPEPEVESDVDATDAAKAHAKVAGIDLAQVKGTGVDGRITATDVDNSRIAQQHVE